MYTYVYVPTCLLHTHMHVYAYNYIYMYTLLACIIFLNANVFNYGWRSHVYHVPMAFRRPVSGEALPRRQDGEVLGQLSRRCPRGDETRDEAPVLPWRSMQGPSFGSGPELLL